MPAFVLLQERYVVGLAYFGHRVKKDTDGKIQYDSPKGEEINLDKELEEAREARNLFILMHQVLWFKMSVLPKRVSVNSGFGFQEGQDFEEEILPRLTALNTPVYVFSGDVGAAPKGDTYRVEEVENVTFIATGMGAAVADNLAAALGVAAVVGRAQYARVLRRG